MEISDARSRSGSDSTDGRGARAAAHAYCPYSHFRVGAAVLTDRGEIFAGCNVENASYGLTICAERNAVFQAVAQADGPLVIRAVVVYTPTAEPTAPCGACRQVINEFGPDAEVLSICDGPARAAIPPERAAPRQRSGRAIWPRSRRESFAIRLRASRRSRYTFAPNRPVDDRNDASKTGPWAVEGGNPDATDRGVESKGWRRQDHDGREPGRRAGDGRAQDAGAGPRSPGPRDVAPGPVAGPVRPVALRGLDRRAAAGEASGARSGRTSRSAAATSTWPAPSSSCWGPSAARSSSATSSTPTPSRSTSS